MIIPSCRDGACPVLPLSDGNLEYHFAGMRRGTPLLYNWILINVNIKYESRINTTKEYR